MRLFELLPRPLGAIFRKLTHLTCNLPILWNIPIFWKGYRALGEPCAIFAVSKGFVSYFQVSTFNLILKATRIPFVFFCAWLFYHSQQLEPVFRLFHFPKLISPNKTRPFYISSNESRLYMLDCCLWNLVDRMRHEEEKIAGNTRDRGEKQGRARIRAGYFEPASHTEGSLCQKWGIGNWER